MQWVQWKSSDIKKREKAKHIHFCKTVKIDAHSVERILNHISFNRCPWNEAILRFLLKISDLFTKKKFSERLKKVFRFDPLILSNISEIESTSNAVLFSSLNRLNGGKFNSQRVHFNFFLLQHAAMHHMNFQYFYLIKRRVRN